MAESSTPFDRNVDQWVHYHESVKGRLRHDLIWRHLERHLQPIKSKIKSKMRVLDVGCGLGDMAALLSDRAGELVLLDFSGKMLEETKKRLAAKNSDLDPGHVTFIHGNVQESVSGLSIGQFDLILCHNILEYTLAPREILASLARLLAPGGLLSLVVPNCLSEPLKKALAKFDFEGARLALGKRESTADLFDNAPKRTFSLEDLDGLISDSKLKVLARYGVRIFADYLPEAVVQLPETYLALFELEEEAAPKLPYINLARFLQVICQKLD